MSQAEHLLLATLGQDFGTVLGLLDWLENPNVWPQAQRETHPDEVTPVTHLWGVTTDSVLAGRLQSKLIEPVQANFPHIQVRVLLVKGLDDIRSQSDHRQMSELLARLVLKAESWRNNASATRTFSMSVAGGRKTMSTALQQMADFFEVDNLFHLALATQQEGDQPPNDIPGIRANREKFFPIVISSTTTHWRYWLGAAWNHSITDIALRPDAFPLTESQIDADPAVICRAEPDWQKQPKSLLDSLQQAARQARDFADGALACGVGSRFLRHDLRELVEYIGKQSATEDIVKESTNVISRYLLALGELTLTKKEQGPSGPGMALSELPELLDGAMLLAVGKRVERQATPGPSWVVPNEIELHLQSDLDLQSELEQARFATVSRHSLLLIMRNLLANAAKHGKPSDDEPVHVTLQVTQTNGSIQLELRNRIPRHSLRKLKKLADEHGRLNQFLRPFEKEGPQAGDGLGLFSVQKIVQDVPELELDGPRVDPWPAETEAYFQVRLTAPAA